MRAALYHPAHGYYRRPRDPFGREGDFYTAEQIQPIFGRLMAAVMRRLRSDLGNPDEFTVVELGAGRGEMAEAFTSFRYVPVEWGRGQMPDRFTGVVFANEFFDALPVDVFQWSGGRFREMQVGCSSGRFVWIAGSPAEPEVENHLSRYAPEREEGMILEANLDALDWIDRIAGHLERGFLMAIDYGYTAPELARFPQGTLMTYRRHVASDAVLDDPGERDITAHVNFTALEDHVRRAGMTVIRRERLAQTLIAAGQPDSFVEALAADGEQRALALRLQLKTLLFGMGESFLTLLAGKAIKAGQ